MSRQFAAKLVRRAPVLTLLSLGAFALAGCLLSAPTLSDYAQGPSGAGGAGIASAGTSAGGAGGASVMGGAGQGGQGATGGTTSAGASSGGSSAGGTAMGGTASGGFATGGTSSGGSASGGTSSGATSTGGTSTAGVGGSSGSGGAAGTGAATCTDNLQNQGESDVDCGGSHCPACTVGARCAAAGDCQSTRCTSTMCVPVSPSNQLLGRAHWTGISSLDNGSEPFRAIDGDVTTRWASGLAQAPGIFFTLDLGAPQYFFAVTIDSSHEPGDEAAGLDLYLSLDGTFTKAVRSASSAPTTTITFDNAVVARYLRFELTATTTTWWSIDEITITQ